MVLAPYEGRYDAGFGQVLIQEEKSWATTSPLKSGLVLTGEIRDIRQIKTSNKKWMYLIARNNDSLIVIKPHQQ